MQYGSMGNNHSSLTTALAAVRVESDVKSSDRSMAIMPTAAARAQPQQEHEKAETCYPKGEQHPRQQIHENAGQSKLRFISHDYSTLSQTQRTEHCLCRPLSLVLTMPDNGSLREGTATVPGHLLSDDNQANGRRKSRWHDSELCRLEPQQLSSQGD